MSLDSTKQVLSVVLGYDEFDSPLNALIAYARPRDPRDLAGNPIPFNGYLFRVITSQGPHAPGGSKNYIVDGKMTAGFAFVAYPAEYRSTGVMTFIVGESGTVFEKDLGPDTTKLAETMTAMTRIPHGTKRNNHKKEASDVTRCIL